MEKIYAIIVDDDSVSRLLLRKTLSNTVSDVVEIVGEADNVPDAVDLIKQTTPDLVFLDIEMPDYSGLQILEFFPDNHDFDIVFVSSHAEYAIDAFTLAAVDYLLKPVSPEKVSHAVNRIIHNRGKQKEARQMQYKTLQQNMITNPKDQKIVLSSSEGTSLVRIDDIIYLKADSSYTEIYLKDGSRMMLSKKLMDFEVLEKIGNFLRTHRSYIVNLDCVKKLLKNDAGIQLSNGTEVGLSSEKKQLLMERLNALKI